MRTALLYILLAAGVLGAVGCEQDRSASEPQTVRDTSEGAPSSAAPSSSPADSTDRPSLRVLVLGNSIAAGLGVSSEAAFPSRLQETVDSLGWNVEIENAGVSGETTAGGLRRIGWLLNEDVDVLVLELGGNDGLRGVDPEVTRSNLEGIIDTTLATYPEAEVLLTAMRLPTNLGPDYTDRFQAVYPAGAEQYDRVQLIELDERLQAGADSLMQDDGIHPTAPGHRLVAQNVWTHLRPLLEEMRAKEPA